MMSNTYLPRIGGVANSVKAFTDEYRKRGHRTIVVAPDYEGKDEDETDVVRIPSIQHLSGIDYSVMLPIPGFLESHLKDFKPDIVHSHHPFLIGSTAQRVSVRFGIPLVFTHHTRYELYTHYTPVESSKMKKFITALSCGYENLCDCVIAPSESIREILLERGVTSPIKIVPTGVYVNEYKNGDGGQIRDKYNIPQDAFVAGYVGRIAQEKNLIFLSKAVVKFLKKNKNAYFLLVGKGPVKDRIRQYVKEKGLSERVILTGPLTGDELINAYHALDVFVFASHTETQGMVITEAMAAQLPVVALDATGIREVVSNGENGYLIKKQSKKDFADALSGISELTDEKREMMKQRALETAEKFSMQNSADSMLDIYRDTVKDYNMAAAKDESFWQNALKQVKTELSMFNNALKAVDEALSGKS